MMADDGLGTGLGGVLFGNGLGGFGAAFRAQQQHERERERDELRAMLGAGPGSLIPLQPAHDWSASFRNAYTLKPRWQVMGNLDGAEEAWIATGGTSTFGEWLDEEIPTRDGLP